MDLGTTPRHRLTPTQRLQLFEAHQGRCCLCGNRIVGAWVDEHLRPLGLGGSNDVANRGPAHRRCADAKTREDLARIAKAKAQKRAALGLTTALKRIPSRPFPLADKPLRNLSPFGPPRPLFIPDACTVADKKTASPQPKATLKRSPARAWSGTPGGVRSR